MTKRAVILLFPAALLCVAPPLAQAELGRLFLTPEQRAALDSRRKARLPDKPQAAVVVESPTTRVNGYIMHGDGRSTVWVNGETLGDGVQQEGMRVTPRKSDPSRVTIEVGEGEAERRIDLKVGQSLDRATGQVKDPLRGGEAGRSVPRTGSR